MTEDRLKEIEATVGDWRQHGGNTVSVRVLVPAAEELIEALREAWDVARRCWDLACCRQTLPELIEMRDRHEWLKEETNG